MSNDRLCYLSDIISDMRSLHEFFEVLNSLVKGDEQ